MEAVASRRLWPSQEVTMIRDVMVWLDGGTSDEVCLAAVADIARRLESNVVIGLFLNPLPLPGPVSGDATAELVDGARKAGDEIDRLLAMRLQLIERPVELRRFDVLADDITNIDAREARSADTFVETERPQIAFNRILVAWNGSRESARAPAEAMPF